MSSKLSIPLRSWFASSGTALMVSIATVLLLLASPRSAAVLYAICAAGALMGMWWVSMRDYPMIWPSRPTWAMLSFAGFALSSIAWSEDPHESLTKPLYLILVIAGTQALIHSFERLTPSYRKRLGFSLIVALVIGLSLAAFEAVTHQLLTRTIYTAFPRLYRGLEEHVQVVDGVVLAISETNIKRRIGALALIVWPLALMVTALTPPRRLLGCLSLVAALAIIMIYVGPHQSSQVAGLLSVAIFVLARLSVALARKALAVGFVCWVLLALPLVWLAHKADLYEANWLPNSARHRIVIWNATANEVLKAPILGVGANATRRIFEEREAKEPTQQRDGAYIVGLTRHAHNAFLQIWYELGAVGAFLLVHAGLAILRAVAGMPASAQPFALAQFAATVAVMSSSYGIWQMWFLASIAFGATALGCAYHFDGEPTPAPAPPPDDSAQSSPSAV